LANESFLASEPVSQLCIQMLTVRDIGTKILKPIDGDDDLFRAFCLGVNAFQDKDVLKKYTAGVKRVDGGQNVRGLGSVHVRTNQAIGPISTMGNTLGGMAPVVSVLGAVKTKSKK
jgi:hypothetical protein